MYDTINLLHHIVRQTAQGCCTALIALSLFLPIATLHARDTGELRHVSPDVKTWITTLTDDLGICCGGLAGALRPQAVNWNDDTNFYRVKVGDQWLFVPDEAIIKSPNRIGDAVVWLEYEGDILSGELTPLVRCFLPASAD